MMFLAPGASNCWVLGQYINYCSNKFASIDQFPKECLSYFWSSFIVEDDFSISHFYGRGSEGNIKTILNLNNKQFESETNENH